MKYKKRGAWIVIKRDSLSVYYQAANNIRADLVVKVDILVAEGQDYVTASGNTASLAPDEILAEVSTIPEGSHLTKFWDEVKRIQELS